MKFKLSEAIEDNIWYHCSPNVFKEFSPNWQGIHFADSIYGASTVMQNRRTNSCNLYTVKTHGLKPLYIDLDPMSWGAKDIATLFIAKINNEVVEGAAGEDISPEEGNYKYDLSPELIHIDNLQESDLDFLKTITKNTPETFKQITDFIEDKGFNSIIYPLAEDKLHKANALIIWDVTLLKIIGYKPNIRV